MDLRELLGADYKEDITADEINSIFEKRVLATGKYENKEKVDAERKRAKQEKADLEAKIKGKLSDDELSKQELEDLKAKLAEAEERERLSKKDTSKLIAEASMAELKTLLELKDGDKELAKLIDNISSDNSELSRETSSLVMKMVKSAYEKGKAAGTKQEYGKMGDMVMGADGKMVDKTEAFVKNLISSGGTAQTFERSNFI